MELDPAKYGKRYLDALAVANRQRYYDEATDMCRTKLRNGGSPAFAVFLANVYRIGKGAFAHCINLWSINIPSSVEHIADGTFYKCPILSNFTLPDTVTSIGHYAFCGCHNLEDLTIPASVKSIGSHAFAKCGRREWVKIPSTVEYLGADVSSIYVPEEIVIPDKLEPAPKDPYELPF